MKKIRIQCCTCGKDMSKYTRDLNRNKNNYCSRECYDKRRKEHLKRLKRTTKFYQGLLETTPCKCGVSDVYLLQLHHIDGNHKNNYPENLEVVCANCHVKRHLKLNKKDKYVYHPKSLTDREILKNL